MGGAMTGWFWIWPALVLGGLILLGYVACRTGGSRGTGPGPSSARQILDARFAHGDFDDQEYRKRRAALQ